MSNDLMYDENSALIAVLLFIAMMLANQMGFGLGKRIGRAEDTELKSQTAAIQTGVMGLLALLLGFTFNMSLQRFDARSHAVIEESGAITKAAMQASLLPAPMNESMLGLLDEYLDLRIQMSGIDMADINRRKQFDSRVTAIQLSMITAIDQAQTHLNMPSISSFSTALAQLIQVENKRSALLRLHVPEPVLMLLFCVFVTAGGMLGYTSGLGNKRPTLPTTLMSGLIVLVVFLIIDLDRPKRGIIQVNQESLLDTQTLVISLKPKDQ